jgi:hypothetical protein
LPAATLRCAARTAACNRAPSDDEAPPAPGEEGDADEVLGEASVVP